MKREFRGIHFLLLLISTVTLGLVFTSCSDDDSDSPNPKDMRIITFSNVTKSLLYAESGKFIGEGSLGSITNLILPGQSVSFSFNAANKQYLAFATMYGASKDWFFAPANPGLKLFDDEGKALIGDVSSQIKLWDNGTKDNVTGKADTLNIAQVEGVKASDLMKLTLAFEEETSLFTLTITNTSKGTANETPFSPGVWAVSNYNDVTQKLLSATPFFEEKKLSNPEITDIAQMGNITKLYDKVTKNTGIYTNIAPVVVVVYEGVKNPVYEVNKLDGGHGLKELSQQGLTSKLMAYLRTLPEVKNVYVTRDGFVPGKSESMLLELKENQNITFVAMFAYSNDWFVSASEPITSATVGDFSTHVSIFDSGTGVSQFPGAGNNQALFGGTPEVESLPVSIVDISKYANLKTANNYLNVTVSK